MSEELKREEVGKRVLNIIDKTLLIRDPNRKKKLELLKKGFCLSEIGFSSHDSMEKLANALNEEFNIGLDPLNLPITVTKIIDAVIKTPKFISVSSKKTRK